MTNQELIANLDIDQKTGKISLEQWSEMRGAIVKLIRDGVKRGAAEMETGYTETEENCKGCMGPCGVCREHEVWGKERILKLLTVIQAGLSMRMAQKAYFRTKSGDDLDKARKREVEFDKMAATEIEQLAAENGVKIEGPPTLFS